MSQVKPELVTEDEDDDESSEVYLRPRRPQDDEIDMTPMIDCVFLLLIFFIYNFQADQTKVVPLPVARYGNPVLGLESAFVTVALSEANQANIYLGDQVEEKTLVKATNQLDQEQEIIEYIRGQLQSAKKKQVIIKANGKLTAKQVDDVYKAVGKALEGQSLHIAVMGESK